MNETRSVWTHDFQVTAHSLRTRDVDTSVTHPLVDSSCVKIFDVVHRGDFGPSASLYPIFHKVLLEFGVYGSIFFFCVGRRPDTKRVTVTVCFRGPDIKRPLKVDRSYLPRDV